MTRRCSRTTLRGALLAVLLGALSLGGATHAEEPKPGYHPPAELIEPDDTFGLSLTKRQEAFKKLHAAEFRAEREAKKRFPQDPGSNEAGELTTTLAMRYKGEVAREYGLTLKQTALITAEGYAAAWPVSDPIPMP
jgi:hypothetical protein